ncbi:RDD family protein [Streptomyces sp. NPDC005573]|uniref:RDD family protein n=1 Tax=Streptomyces sp. NPDC005573 TaxID=3156890 RepID=UPI0033B1E5EE
MSELVTGEAVALELRPAKLPSRALAVLLDLLVVFVLYVLVTVALVAATSSLDDAAQLALSIAAFILVLVGVPIAVETLSHGRSLGKAAFGLRVVRDDGGPIRFRHALMRGAMGVVEILMTLGVIACIASLASARGRRLGDVFAGTLVVRERIPQGHTGFAPAPPPWLVGRFAELDLSGVPDGLWLAVRQCLTRMHQLDPQVAFGMAQRLAAELAARTGTGVPAGVDPAAFLAAVVHERQTRDARQTFGSAGPGAGVPTGAEAGGHLPPPVPRAPGTWTSPTNPQPQQQPHATQPGHTATGPSPDSGSGYGTGSGTGSGTGAAAGSSPASSGTPASPATPRTGTTRFAPPA